MTNASGSPVRSRFGESFISALFDWFDVFDLFDCVFEPDGLVPALGFIACVGAFAFLGVVVYELLFDPNAIDVASRLDSLSIDPDKWFPRL